jgi:hypothetical protein
VEIGEFGIVNKGYIIENIREREKHTFLARPFLKK